MKFLPTLFLTVLGAAAQELPITIYDFTELKPEVVEATTDRLSRIFRLSGIKARIHTGEATTQEANTVLYPNVFDACRARRDIALRLAPKAPPGLPSAALAMAAPFSPGGVNVTVFMDRVEAAAYQQTRPMELLLAHVIAHEIGHVLMRSSRHSKHGLMSSHWNEHEFSLMPVGALIFSKAEARQMLGNLAGQGCS